MFKRESEQPVKNSFEENNEKKKRRPLRERLSNIPVRRRVEAVLLAVVTIMASLSIDWSSLLASAASDPTIESGQSIYTVYEAAADNKKLTSAKISVKIPSADKEVEVSYTWEVYQNLTDKSNPKSGVPVGNGGSGTIYCGSKDFVDVILSNDPTTAQNGILPDVVLLDDETAAVVFKLTSKDSSNITCKSFGTTDSTYVKDKDGDWNGPISGKAIDYTADNGTLTDVTLSDLQDKIGLTAGQSYTFPDITWNPAYRRNLEFNEKTDPDLLIEKTGDSTFTVGDNIGDDGGEAIITVGGTGVTEKDVTVKVVSFALKGTGTGNSVFPYKVSSYKPANLYTATCNNEIEDITTYFQTTFEVDGTSVTAPQDPGTYTMTIKGKDGTDYAGLSYTTDFTIEQGTLTQAMFDGSTATVKSGGIEGIKIEGITDGTFSTSPLRKLVYGEDFDAKVTNTTAEAGKVTYTVTITGKNNFKNGDTAPTLTATETSGVSLDSFVDHIGFKDQTGDYDGTPKTPGIVFYDSNNNAIETPAFTYKVKYNGTERSTGNPVTDAPSIINAGEYTATVEGTGIYSGSFTTPATYVLKPISFTKLTGLTVTLEEAYFEESDPFVIEVDKLTYDSGTKTLADGTYVLKDDYSREVGTHNVTILGYGNYEGEATAQYTVFPSLPTCATFELKGDDNKWVKTAGTLTADNTTDEWDYVLTHNRAYTYKGSAIEPDIRANVNGDSLVVGSGKDNMTTDTGVNNINVTSSDNKAYFILTLPEKYASKTIKVEFEIEPAQLGMLSFTNNLVKSYTGAAIELEDNEFEVKDKNGNTLIKGTDYTIDDKSYKNNVNAGTATITATGNGNYTGTASNTFTIRPIDINDVDITINDQQLNISGKTVITNMDDVVITKTIHDDYGVDKVIRFSSEDFTLSNYANNEHAWIDGDTANQPQVTINGKRNLTEATRVVKFQILNKTLTGLTWKLAVSGDSYEGVLGSPGTTINLSDPKYGYVVDYAPSLPAAFIKIYDSNGKKMNPGNYTYMETPSEAEGKNTITIVGKGDYRGGEYYFTYDVRKRDIKDCVFEQENDGDANSLPTFKLTYGGEELTAGEDNDYTYVTDAEKDSNGKYVAKDGYTVTFTGKNSYTGTKTGTFHIGQRFDSEHVFVTMYGPNGTKTVNGENRLTYFGNNDPYFILTSNKEDKTSAISGGPAYTNGKYGPSGTDYDIIYGTNYDIIFSPSDPIARRKVGTTVTVTFKASDGSSTWYTPKNSNVVTYTYTVVPGAAGYVGESYGSLASGLKIYTSAKTGSPQEKDAISFPESGTTSGGVIPFTGFKYKYTIEGVDPEIYISYDPSKVTKEKASQNTAGNEPELPGEISYSSDPVKVKFNDPNLFTVNKASISADDSGKTIEMTPVNGGWLASLKLQVTYDFEPASLSDAKITFNPGSAEYAYRKEPVNVIYNVNIGSKTTLEAGSDYKLVGYYKYPSEESEKKKVDDAIEKPSLIEGDGYFTNKLSEDEAPEEIGDYFLVIGPGTGSHYQGYNIAKFSIVKSAITAALSNSNFSVTYGSGEDAPGSEELVVKGENGEPLAVDTDYKIGSPNITGPGDASVTIEGIGKYKGSQVITYKVVADISSGRPADLPDFNITNLGLTDEHLDTGTKALKLVLKNDGGLPFIDGQETRFDPATLTLTYRDSSNKDVTLKSSWLTTTVTSTDGNGDNLTSVGKKMITVSPAVNAPVTGERKYYVEVYADISTANISLVVDRKEFAGDPIQIPYTGSAMTVTPRVTFRGSTLGDDCYNPKNSSYTDAGKQNIKITGAATYYKGEASKDFYIVYDLSFGSVEVIYKLDKGGAELLSNKTFPYTGESIGDELKKNSKVAVKVKNTDTELILDKDYTITFANDIYPGKNRATATINAINGRSISSQIVYFSIGGTKFEDGECTVTLEYSSVQYDGTEKKPSVTFSYNGKALTQDDDYRVTYSNNINASTDTNEAKVIITGINGRYDGEVVQTFTISPKPLTTDDVEFPDVPFGGRDSNEKLLPSIPSITVKSGEKTLVQGTDYDISYGDGEKTAKEYFTKNPGDTYDVTITGKGNYTGTVTADAKQLSGSIDGANIMIDREMTSVYNGKKVAFSEDTVIKNGEGRLRKGTDYSIEIPKDIINAGTYEIKVTALQIGDYYQEGGNNTRIFTYEVTPKPIEGNEKDFVITLYDPDTGNSIGDTASFTFKKNSQIVPLIELVDNAVKKEHDASVGYTWTTRQNQVEKAMESFTPVYGDNKLAGEKSGSVTLTAGGNYTGTLTAYFNIGTDISGATLTYDRTSANYDGSPKEQTITVSYSGTTLTPGNEYETPVEYIYEVDGETRSIQGAPTQVGIYTPVIKGKPENGFYGEKRGETFRIIAQNKTGNIEIRLIGPNGEVDARDYVCHYNTKQQKPLVTVYDTSVTPKAALNEGTDYTVSYGNNVNVGSGYVYVALKGNYTGTAQVVFFIDQYDISNRPIVFTEGEDGTIKNIPESSFPYTPLFKITGIDDDGKEFEISYADSRLKQYLVIPDESIAKKPGKGSLKVSGTGNLKGTASSNEYEIYGRLSESNVSVKAPVYTGTQKDPVVTVKFAGQTLVKDTDYSLRVIASSLNGQSGGDVVVTGLGYFSGDVYLKYGEGGDVSTLVLRGYSDQYVYSGRFAGPEESAIYAADSEGNQVIPADKLECTFASDVDAAACISAGATVTITSKATLDDGTVVAGPSATYKIVPRNISSCDIRQLTTDTYTGKGLTPPIAVSYDRKTYSGTVVVASDVIALVSGRDYSLNYRNNVYPGTAEITVTGKGNYTGTKRFMFTIKVPDMGLVTVKQSGSDTLVEWTARPHVSGYRILYNANGKADIVTTTTDTKMTLKDTVPSTVGVQAFVKDTTGKNTYYGAPKYVAVTR